MFSIAYGLVSSDADRFPFLPETLCRVAQFWNRRCAREPSQCSA